ncbi:MAG: polymer-forming cytoskeletal protein [Bacteroidetes bacterium]|nr:polymer-forming cytoskeletal protein [Bacteroidota bacterium]MCH8523453.1 polymer-forming cytoskeletal protein [Balneolales bacterium]
MQDQSNVPAINMISDGTRITGTLETKKDFRISGELEGSLKVEGKCVVSASAVIKGDIIATEADIAGKVEGQVSATNRLVLRQTCSIVGDIITKSLLVEEGAKFEGACHMGDRTGISKNGVHPNLFQKGSVEKEIQTQ